MQTFAVTSQPARKVEVTYATFKRAVIVGNNIMATDSTLDKSQQANAIPNHKSRSEKLQVKSISRSTSRVRKPYLTGVCLCLSMLLGTMPAAPTSLGWVRLGRANGMPAFTGRLASATLNNN